MKGSIDNMPTYSINSNIQQFVESFAGMPSEFVFFTMLTQVNITSPLLLIFAAYASGSSTLVCDTRYINRDMINIFYKH